MCNLYESIKSLCEENGITGSKMCADIGISRNLLTELKAGRRNGISADKAVKIADYFGVSVDRVLGEDPSERTKKTLSEGEEDLEEYLEALRTRPEMRMLFSLSKDATREDVEKAVAIIEALRKTEKK